MSKDIENNQEANSMFGGMSKDMEDNKQEANSMFDGMTKWNEHRYEDNQRAISEFSGMT